MVELSAKSENSCLFPRGFMWGAATSSYQIEGAFDEDGRGESIWDRFCRTPGKVFNGDRGDHACNHYHKYAEDIELMKVLGLDAYRFSIAWPRIYPHGTGKPNEKGLDFYDRLVDGLLAKGIVPFATLYHWDLPQEMEEKGGWRSKDTSRAFGDYAGTVVDRLSDRVVHWATLNEPPCSSVEAYEKGRHAPGAQEPPGVVNQIIHNHLLAHGLGMQAIRERARIKPEAGLVHNPRVAVPVSQSAADHNAAARAWYCMNAWWFDPIFTGSYPADQWREKGSDIPEITNEEMAVIAQPLDYMGLNIYSGKLVEADVAPGSQGFRVVPYPDSHPETAMGWPVNADSIYFCLKHMHDCYALPKYYITENGCAYDDVPDRNGKVEDPRRIDYVRSHIASAHRAIAEGINLAGYFVWSLMDNFEWDRGYSKRFGITYIDYPTEKRILKKSALWYRDVISRNGIE